MTSAVPPLDAEFTPDETNSRLLRDAFGCFATGITVVTCAGSDGPVCMTANSFASVSLDPPLIMWALDREARRYPLIGPAEHFAIHVLGAGQADLCMACAREAFALRDLPHTENAQGVPLIAGCLARFECHKDASHSAGDHDIIVGRVTRAQMRSGPALTFFAGGYGQIDP